MSDITSPNATPGALALVGSGEYTDAMNKADRLLLGTIGGPTAARVVLLPIASGLEANGPSYWNDLGQRHFAALGVGDIRSSLIIDAASASDPAQLDLLRDANFFYFSGGNPNHVIASLRGSPAWEIILSAYQRGAVMAGCSAGAMAMSGYTISARMSFTSDAIKFVPSLGVVPQVIVFPHFDRMIGRLGKLALQTRLLTAPKESFPVGIDEDTALIRLAPPDAATGKARWRVVGRQSVTIFWPGISPQTLSEGEEVEL